MNMFIDIDYKQKMMKKKIYEQNTCKKNEYYLGENDVNFI
jgi:hypothetical protein